MLYEVALPASKYINASGFYTYESDENLTAGQMVLVPFGKQNKVGIVLKQNHKTNLEKQQIKRIIKTGDTLVSSVFLNFIAFASQYYKQPLNKLLFAAIPNCITLLSNYSDDLQLAKKSLKTAQNTPPWSIDEKPPTTFELSTAQQKAYHLLDAYCKDNEVVLLQGITGSGKTVLYFKQIEEVLKQGKQILFLLPEINLANHFYEKIKDRYPSFLIHSGKTDLSNGKAFLHAKHKTPALFVGTRKALWFDYANLGLIIIDEEHDDAFEQQNDFFYNAKNLAIYMAKQKQVPIILGSATPCLPSLLKVKNNEFKHIELNERYNHGGVFLALPTVCTCNVSKDAILSDEIISKLKQNHENGNQSLVFINRRGYAPVLQCEACNWLSQCDACSAYQVIHKANNTLCCHHCGNSTPLPTRCPECSSSNLKTVGCGTEQIEEFLQQQFADLTIVRWDRDSLNQTTLKSTVKDIESGKVDMIVGTQMIAKGFHFKNLTLVVAVNIDNALYSHNYTATHKAFSLMHQVIGRSGREKPGKVLLQTNFAEHPFFEALKQHDYNQFSNQILQERKQNQLPPYAFHALFWCQDKNEQKAISFSKHIKQVLTKNQSEVCIYDPVPMTLKKLNHKYRVQLLLTANNREALHIKLNELHSYVSNLSNAPQWFIEVDPTVT